MAESQEKKEYFTTPKGTKLPLLMIERKKKNDKGQWEAAPPQPYLQVAQRVVWFREENPLGIISTEVKELTDKSVLYSATIKILNDKGEYIQIADAIKREHFAHFSDAEEKAQTSAIGRALALCGYGTQFAPEFDEEKRLADAPTERQKPAAPKTHSADLQAAIEEFKKVPLENGEVLTDKGVKIKDAWEKHRVKAIPKAYEIRDRLEKNQSVEAWEISFLDYGIENNLINSGK